MLPEENERLNLTFCVFVVHKHFQGRQPFHHFMLKRSQFGHYSHQTGILAFYADLLFDSHFLAFPCEQLICFVMRTMSGPKESVSYAEPS